MTTLFARICIVCAVLISYGIQAEDSLTQALYISQQGMAVRAEQIKVVSENIANELSPGYRRKTVHVGNQYDEQIGTQVVKIKKYNRDYKKPLKMVYNPHHPAADSAGMVAMPNVDKDIELADAAEAQLAYEANAAVLEVTKNMFNKAIELLK